MKKYECDKNKCPIVMWKISKNEICKNFGPLIKHGPHWINFIILISRVEKIDILDVYIKIGTKLFHLIGEKRGNLR